ncbi:hypothetical protein BJF95_02235 [Rhizobium oryziradicis]|uniref:Uncharacterized protein n=1 Tax=Rhizobium oryziradicis TaxID=1867956 RepID=A0A1Q8ZYE7_9HYPH|nr:hypothetical protein BJF95_02235 [Rhizobium oryziradicis]
MDSGQKCAFVEFTSMVRDKRTVLFAASQKIYGITRDATTEHPNIMIFLDYFVIYFRALPFFQTKLRQEI